MSPTRAATAPAPLVDENDIINRNWTRKQGPFYRVNVVSQMFFGMSASWLRLKLTVQAGRPHTSFTTPDGHAAMDFRRKNPSDAASARVFLLSDIEPMARSLRALGDIDAERLDLVLRMVALQAELFGLTSTAEKS